MIQYSDNDFESIDDPSEPRIRFILSDWSKHDLSQIRLFRPEKARELEQVTLPFFRKLYPYLFRDAGEIPENTQDFEELKEIKDTVQSIENTKEWLTSLVIPPQTEMIVSYDFRIALLIPWSLFAEAYEKFCYSSLDDICVVSTDERWYFIYFHEDQFLFGKRKENIED
jgi:hypothetical protein